MMKLKVNVIFNLMTRTARADIIHTYGRPFYRQWVGASKKRLREILPETPDIGSSIFSFNYLYGPCYFAWYGGFLTLGIEKERAREWIWRINEDFVKIIPRPLLRWFCKTMYLGSFRRKAVEAEQRGKAGTLHPFDWRIEYTDIDDHTFRINIYECGMLKLAKKFGTLEMFPTVCRMDYLFSHYFEQGFARTGTLADGNDCCNCWYQFPGTCEWAPEKGFIDRK
ncbi:MAG: L-2-amino-thiazoline-4-carboxylic acid hydrolase [Anaerolineaceae bacterium]